MRWAIIGIAVIHGLLHVIGFTRRFPWRALWLAPTALFLVTAITPLEHAWLPGGLALISSQLLIITAWRDAKFGTLVNVVLLGLLGVSFALYGPLSLPAEYAREVEKTSSSPGPVVTDADLAPLPEPVQRYLRVSGAVGKPRVSRIHVTWTGRIRGGANEPWMPFTAEQVNTLGPTPTRLFLMHATMSGLPVNVFHRFAADGATFRVRPLGLFNLVDASGQELTRAETVTILNDLAIVAPSRLLDPSVRFEALDAHAARVVFTRATETVSAELRFDDEGNLVDFISDDRLQASADGTSFKPLRWSTPLRQPTEFQGRRVMKHGDAVWHEPTGPWTYGEFEVQSVTFD